MTKNLLTRLFRKPPVTRQQMRNRRIWRDALLSGDYDQTNDTLVKISDDGHQSYCCLGLACNVVLNLEPAVRPGDGMSLDLPGFPVSEKAVTNPAFVSTDLLPIDVFADTFGITDIIGHPHADIRATQQVFAKANDRAHWTFAQIADLIPMSRWVTTVDDTAVCEDTEY